MSQCASAPNQPGHANEVGWEKEKESLNAPQRQISPDVTVTLNAVSEKEVSMRLSAKSARTSM